MIFSVTELFCVAIPALLTLGAVILMDNISAAYGSYDGWGYYNIYWRNSGFNVTYAAILAACWAIATVGISLILCCVRKIKAGRFWSTCLFWRVIAWVIHGLREIHYGGSAMRKLVLVIVGCGLLCAAILPMPLVIVILIILVARMMKQYEAIRDGVDQIRGGNAGYQIPVVGNPRGEMQTLASDINDISNGLELAVRKELKNQRMKSELISNVSHDLKTPLATIKSSAVALAEGVVDEEELCILQSAV